MAFLALVPLDVPEDGPTMNKFDDVRLGVAALLARQAEQPSAYDPAARSGDGLGACRRLRSRARLYFTAQLVRRDWWRRRSTPT